MALISPNYFDCVVAIGVENPSDPTKKQWVGTGFLFGYRNDTYEENKYTIYIVSNKHVFEGSKQVFLKFNPQAGQPAKDYTLDLEDKDGHKMYKEHPNANIDVAVASINATVLQKDGIHFNFFRYNNDVYTKSEMSNLGVTEGDGVYVLGYPMGLVGTTRQYVILRHGAIARVKDMLEGYSSDYVIDSFVFPGNSGGPVIIKPEVMCIEGTKSINESRLIGLVKSYITYTDVAVSAQTGRNRIAFEENTGLTNVEPVDHIIEVIEQK